MDQPLRNYGAGTSVTDGPSPPRRERVGRSEARKIGARVREARTSRGVTLATLSARIGLTYQQLQKYETGANRISASTLVHIGLALDTPIEFFLSDIAELRGESAAAALPVTAARRSFVRARVAQSCGRVLARECEARGRTLLSVLAEARSSTSERELVVSGTGVPTLDHMFRIAWALCIEPSVLITMVEAELLNDVAEENVPLED